MVTLQLRNHGKFAGKAKLVLGDNKPDYKKAQPTVNGKPAEVWQKEKARAHWDGLVEKGRLLMLEATNALGHGRYDATSALRAMASDRKACAAYLASEKGKREHRFTHLSEGFVELEDVETFLAKKV